MPEPVVLITGAGRGIGRALAQAFAARGARVCLNDISPLNVEALAEDMQRQGLLAHSFVMDVAKKISAQALLNQVTDAFGRLDVLINAAAVEPQAPVLKVDEWDLLRTLQVNLLGAFLMTQSAARVMRAQGGGLVLNLVDLQGREGQPERTAYVSSQYGLAGFTRQAAPELASVGVRLNLLGTGLGALASHRHPQVGRTAAALAFWQGDWRTASGWLVETGD